MKSSIKIVAIMSVYNEELYLPRCLKHLWNQGIQTYVIDNDSIDRTPEIVRSFLKRGVINVEKFPRRGMFELERLLRREEEIALELGADWYIHHDADEIRQAPNPYRTLAEAILAVDSAGYNAINFDEFVFVPTGPEENYEHALFVEQMHYYYFFEPRPRHRINAWKNFGQKFDLHSSGGHQVQFEGRRVYPQNFILRHYLVLSLPHAIRKYCGKVYNELERKERGWHGARADLHPGQIQFPDRSRLRPVSRDNTWDRSDPWKVHAIFENVPELPQEGKVSGVETIGYLPPAPFIVGVESSGTTLLGLILDSHPSLAIAAETHFIPQISQQLSETSDQREFFLKALVRHRMWNDFYLDPAVLRTRVAAIDPFDLTQGMRAFYKLYAEHFGKPRWGDKTSTYVMSMELIQRLLPEARFVHIIRDGRDVALSNLDKWFGPNSIQETASWWVWTIAEARRQAQNVNYYLEIRYEDLILNPTETLKHICEFINLPWDPTMLSSYEKDSERLMVLKRNVIDPRSNKLIDADDRLDIHSITTHQPEQNRIGLWRNEMKISDRKSFEVVAAPMLRELGYEVD